ncbi:MAG TPA: DoxX family protein [Longimicrobiaceae bacterium]|nr:DoxX family protein [Longimicrobiaceae bacterium]
MPSTFFMSRFGDLTLNLLRIVTGLLFMQHGAQKLFGWFRDEPGQTVELFSLMGLAGVLEFFGGALIVLGLLTRPVAFVLAGEMAFAYFTAHFPRAFWPIQSGGESAALFCFIYLFLSAHGPGSFSVDAIMNRNRTDPETVT